LGTKDLRRNKEKVKKKEEERETGKEKL